METGSHIFALFNKSMFMIIDAKLVILVIYNFIIKLDQNESTGAKAGIF